MEPIALPASPVAALGFHAAAGPTATWPDVFGRLVAEAEARFGPRDARWLCCGIAFEDAAQPLLWSPGGRPFHIAACLTRAAAADPAIALVELAQAAVALLAPSSAPATALTEGMATAFRLEVASAAGLPLAPPAHPAALTDTLQLIGWDPQTIARARDTCPDPRLLTPDALIAAARPGLSPPLAERLCAPLG